MRGIPEKLKELDIEEALQEVLNECHRSNMEYSGDTIIAARLEAKHFLKMLIYNAVRRGGGTGGLSRSRLRGDDVRSAAKDLLDGNSAPSPFLSTFIEEPLYQKSADKIWKEE